MPHAKTLWNKIFIIGVIGILFIITQTSPTTNNNVKLKTAPQNSAMTYHPTILIDGNTELASFINKTGSGTKSDPYIIENLKINAQDASGISGIYISNTNSYLIIRNCEIYNATDETGVKLSVCANVIIDNCYIHETLHAIAFDVENGTIKNNNINNSYYNGIDCGGAINTIITNNYINNTYREGIRSSLNSTITQNTIENSERGVYIISYATGTITNNTFKNNVHGILIDGSYNFITKNIISNNVHGITFYLNNPNADIIWFNGFFNNGLDVNEEYGQVPYSSNIKWDNTTYGNYWDKYTATHPLATQHNGVWSEPYAASAFILDNFPLISPFWIKIIIIDDGNGNENNTDDTNNDEELTANDIIVNAIINNATIIAVLIITATAVAIFSFYYSKSQKCAPGENKWYCPKPKSFQ